MDKKSIMIFLFLLIAAAARPALAEDVNIASRSSISVSDTANFAWEAKNIADADIGPTKGWLGRWDGKNKPWVRIVFPMRAAITRVRVMPASYLESGSRRYARPKKVTLLLKGDSSKTLEFDLKDREDVFQDLDAGGTPADEVSIVIDEVYADAKNSDMVGFQEVQVIVSSDSLEATLPSERAPGDTMFDPIAEVKKIDEKAAGGDKETSGVNKDGAPKGSLSPEEKAILNDLRDLIKKLEQKFMQD
jgi:hypothetical protein